MSDPKDKSRYPIAASMTEEGKERERLYFEALGRFVHMFARMESALTLSLWFYAKTPHPIARAVFSGVRTKEAVAALGRIATVTAVSPEVRADITEIASHVRGLTEARNDILHYGAERVAEGNANVSNAIKALSEEHISVFQVSPAILADMTADCRKIIMLLRGRHAGIPALKSIRNRLALETILHQPWRYKHEPEFPLKPRKQRREGRSKGKVREAPPKPSRGSE